MRKLFLALAAVCLVLISTPMSAFAADAPAGGEASLAEVRLSPFLVTSLIALFIPLVNGIFTKLTTSQTAKAIFTIVLSAINTFVTGLVMVGGFYVFSKESFVTWIMTTVIAVASYLGVFKPAGLTSGPIALPDPNRPGQTINVPGKLSFIGRQ